MYESIERFTRGYEYTPLTMLSCAPMDVTNTKFELRKRVGDFDVDVDKVLNPEEVEQKLEENSLIHHGKAIGAKLLICITMYNEPFSQMLESLAGIYRAYYELGKIST